MKRGYIHDSFDPKTPKIGRIWTKNVGDLAPLGSGSGKSRTRASIRAKPAKAGVIDRAGDPSMKRGYIHDNFDPKTPKIGRIWTENVGELAPLGSGSGKCRPVPGNREGTCDRATR
jgi:hypothetical protein